MLQDDFRAVTNFISIFVNTRMKRKIFGGFESIVHNTSNIIKARLSRFPVWFLSLLLQ